jgi:hypothetical protein
LPYVIKHLATSINTLPDFMTPLLQTIASDRTAILGSRGEGIGNGPDARNLPEY